MSHFSFRSVCESFPDQQIERFSALRDVDGEIACRKSHLAVIQLAKERNYPWVAIVEDDCAPYPEFHTELARILPYLWQNKSKWEIYNGGPNPFGVSRFDNMNRILLIDNWISTQFIIINSSAYDKLLAHNPEVDKKKVDDYYASKCVTLTSVPMITFQHNMYSDLAKEYTNNELLFNSSRRKLQSFFS